MISKMKASQQFGTVMDTMKDNDNNPDDFSPCRKTDFDQKYK